MTTLMLLFLTIYTTLNIIITVEVLFFCPDTSTFTPIENGVKKNRSGQKGVKFQWAKRLVVSMGTTII